MAPKPLIVLCYTATVLIVLATVATSAPVEAEEDIQQRNAKTVEHRQQQQQPQQPQQQQGEQLGIAPLVNSLLTSLLRQTLYTRMENLLLDGSSASSRIPPPEMPPSYPSPPQSHPESVRKSGERRRIVDSAVRNYQEQDGALSQDFTKLAGKSEQMRQSLEDETCPFDFGFVWESTVNTFSKKIKNN